MSHIMHTYARQNVAFERGEGVWVWDTQGKKYLDALCGIAVVSLGHSHPGVTKALQDQAGKIIQVSNGFQIPQQTQLAADLTKHTGMDKVFFNSTGAEANETAIKIARRYGHLKGIDVPTIVVMEGAFHGRTMATLTASAGKKGQETFEPLVEGFIRCPYNDLNALEKLIQEHNNIVGVMLEPIQGEGGIHVPDDNYLPGIRKLCDDNQLLMILDEIQSGMGRTGKLFAFQHSNIIPDVLTSAKALGNGYPIACCIAKGEAAEILGIGHHGTTFGGSPLACTVGQAVLDAMVNDKIPEHAAEMGQYLIEGFRKKLAGFDKLVEVRGKGMMIGIELKDNCTHLRPAGLENDFGLVFNVTQLKIVRLVPPLIMQKAEADLLIEHLSQLIIEKA